MCVYCQCPFCGESNFEDQSTYLRDMEEYCECCELLDDESNEPKFINSDDQEDNYDFCDCEEICSLCDSMDEYNICNCPDCNPTSIEYCDSLRKVKQWEEEIRVPHIVIEGSNREGVKFKDNLQNGKSSSKKRGLRFCKRDVSCLFKKQKYNITVLPLSMNSKNMEVISKPIKPKPKNSGQNTGKKPKIKIATPRVNRRWRYT